MSRRSSLAEHVAQVPMFAACTKQELQRVAKLSTEVEVPAGKTLARQGEAGREFVIILDGIATVIRNDKKIAELGPGDYFGETALLDPGERTATVVAESPMRIAVVTPSEFSEMLDDVPALAHKIMRGLARQIRELAKSTPI
jgi:CRP-like cAMP-binding protein